MSIEQKDTYFVAVKIFLEKDEKFLVMKDNFGDWDLPGGRIKKDEFDTSLEDVIKRKMSQEVGSDVEYKLGKPIVLMRHERIEASGGNPKVRIFGVGYEASFIKGEIKLSERHPEMMWADPKTYKPEDYFTGGWLKGVKEYLELKRAK